MRHMVGVVPIDLKLDRVKWDFDNALNNGVIYIGAR